MRNTVRLGSGAGFAGDRIDAAVDLVRHGQLDDLILECLAERTIALAQLRRSSDPASGYDPLAEQRFRALLPETLPRGTRIISNLGAANPRMAGQLAIRTADELGLRCRVAVVTGDDVLDQIDPDTPALENGKPLSAHGPTSPPTPTSALTACSRAWRPEPTLSSLGGLPTRRFSSRR